MLSVGYREIETGLKITINLKPIISSLPLQSPYFSVSLLSVSTWHLAPPLPMDGFPSSPSNSSLSSSDLDTESTGSFFPDRSTTLGTLMGVTFYNRSTSSRLNQEQRIRPRGTAAAVRRWRWRRAGGRRWRFNLCGDHMSGPTSLGDFLQVERSLYGGGLVGNEAVRGGSGRLFDNGMVLPPALSAAAPPQAARRRLIVRRLGRLPVLFTGICCGGRKCELV